MKGYVFFIANRPSNRDVKPGDTLGAFYKGRLMPALGFPFTRGDVTARADAGKCVLMTRFFSLSKFGLRFTANRGENVTHFVFGSVRQITFQGDLYLYKGKLI